MRAAGREEDKLRLLIFSGAKSVCAVTVVRNSVRENNKCESWMENRRIRNRCALVSESMEA